MSPLTLFFRFWGISSQLNFWMKRFRCKVLSFFDSVIHNRRGWRSLTGHISLWMPNFLSEICLSKDNSYISSSSFLWWSVQIEEKMSDSNNTGSLYLLDLWRQKWRGGSRERFTASWRTSLWLFSMSKSVFKFEIFSSIIFMKHWASVPTAQVTRLLFSSLHNLSYLTDYDERPTFCISEVDILA